MLLRLPMVTSQPIVDYVPPSKDVGCEFCDEFAGGISNSFSTLYGNTGRIILSSENFNVIPTIGQIVDGYLLIVPKAHYRALADLPTGLREELKALMRVFHAASEAGYGTHVMFEHGTRTSSSGGCGIAHAHMHIVPLAQLNDPIEIMKCTYPFKIIESFEQIAEEPFGSSYLYYEDTSLKKHVFQTDYLPSQYVRRLVARAVGSEDWDWRDAKQEKRLADTIAFFSTLLKNPRDVVSHGT
jgi:diadenosine tetraphosphate (Ap4A) HIT family hydrolase